MTDYSDQDLHQDEIEIPGPVGVAMALAAVAIWCSIIYSCAGILAAMVRN